MYGNQRHSTSAKPRFPGTVSTKHTRSTEVWFRMTLVSSRIRGWQMHPLNIPGTPDFYWPQQRLAVFIDGCFWHGCPRCCRYPRTNAVYWRTKIEHNMDRDRSITRHLRNSRVVVLRLWEHDLRSRSRLKRQLCQIRLICGLPQKSKLRLKTKIDKHWQTL